MSRAFKKSRPVKEQQTLTEFIDKSVSIVAACELANQKHFSLPPAQWNAFIEALDRPAHMHPGLRRLLSEPSALEQSNHEL